MQLVLQQLQLCLLHYLQKRQFLHLLLLHLLVNLPLSQSLLFRLSLAFQTSNSQHVVGYRLQLIPYPDKLLTQIYPGPALVLGAIAVWAVLTGGATAWVVLGVSALAITVTSVGKYVLVGGRLHRAGVAPISLLVGGAAGIVGFFSSPWWDCPWAECV